MKKYGTKDGISGKTVAEWAKEYKILPQTLISRLNRGTPLQKALRTPVRKHGPKIREVTINGVSRTLADWAAQPEVSVCEETISRRLHAGVPPIEAVFASRISTREGVLEKKRRGGNGTALAMRGSNVDEFYGHKVKKIPDEPLIKARVTTTYTFELVDVAKLLGISGVTSWHIDQNSNSLIVETGGNNG